DLAVSGLVSPDGLTPSGLAASSLAGSAAGFSSLAGPAVAGSSLALSGLLVSFGSSAPGLPRLLRRCLADSLRPSGPRSPASGAAASAGLAPSPAGGRLPL